MKRTAFVLLLVLLFFLSAAAITPEEIIDIDTFYHTDRILAGSNFKLALEMRIMKEWHINSNKPSSEFAIPTQITFQSLPGITIDRIIFPPAKTELLPAVNLKVDYYDGTSYVIIEGRADKDLKPGTYDLKGTFSYQGCKGRECLMPANKNFDFKLDIAPAGTLVQIMNAQIFSPHQEAVSAGAEVDSTEISEMIAEKGLLITLILLFFGGLALNLTPCVYPLIPITISYFGGLQQKGKRVLNASAYVLGLAITYSILGTFAALSGEMLGKQLTNPIVTIAIAGIMVMLALSMFGLYEIRVPSFLMNIAGGEARSGIAGSLVMGTTMGIIAAPCIGPFIVGLMTYVAKLGDPFKGFLMFFILALGMGIPYLILGIFSSNITSLPRSGEWMIGVRKIFGFILVIMAVYFLDPVLSNKAYTILFSLSFLIGGFWLIVLDRSGEKNRGFHIFKSVIAIVMIILGTWLFRPDTRSAVQIQWQEYSETLLAQAKEKGKPVIIDFFADWCIPCKELDKLTFADPLVQDYADRFVFLKADLTQEKSEFSKAIKAQYSIKGVPTVVFIKPDGGENASVRLTGFEKAKEFVKRMEKTLGK